MRHANGYNKLSQDLLIPPFDADGDLPPGTHEATWSEFKDRLCLFNRSDRRLKLCQLMELLVQDASRSQIVERIVFGGSFITQKTEPNDFDCIVILRPSVEYESLTPAQLWVADTGQATRRYGGDVFVARADQPTRAA